MGRSVKHDRCPLRPCVWLGLWLLGVSFVIDPGLLSAVPNPDTTVLSPVLLF